MEVGQAWLSKCRQLAEGVVMFPWLPWVWREVGAPISQLSGPAASVHALRRLWPGGPSVPVLGV